MASAVIGVPVLLVLIYFGGVAYVTAAAIVLAVAVAEFIHFRRDWTDPLVVLTAVLVAGICVGSRDGRLVWLAWLGGALIVPPLAAAITAEADERAPDVIWTLTGVTYVGFLGSFIVRLRFIEFDARAWVYLALLSTFAVDTAAYFVGRRFGKHALAPRISPKKTVEGFIGGCVAGVAAVIGLNYLLGIDANITKIVALAIALPIVATLGDLVESIMKRILEIKDASNLIPGHGGVLDRLDSVLFTFTLVYVFTQFIVY